MKLFRKKKNYGDKIPDRRIETDPKKNPPRKDTYICSMEVGDSGWIYAFSLVFDLSGRGFLTQFGRFEQDKLLSHSIHLHLTEKGYVVDISRCKKKWHLGEATQNDRRYPIVALIDWE